MIHIPAPQNLLAISSHDHLKLMPIVAVQSISHSRNHRHYNKVLRHHRWLHTGMIHMKATIPRKTPYPEFESVIRVLRDLDQSTEGTHKHILLDQLVAPKPEGVVQRIDPFAGREFRIVRHLLWRGHLKAWLRDGDIPEASIQLVSPARHKKDPSDNDIPPSKRVYRAPERIMVDHMAQNTRHSPEHKLTFHKPPRPRRGHRDRETRMVRITEDEAWAWELPPEVLGRLLGDEADCGHEDCVTRDGNAFALRVYIEFFGTPGDHGIPLQTIWLG